ncbi:hypothetical protein Dimus_000637 [Dionaea muscipula]
MTVIHLKKKDIVKSKVRGIEMEFDHEKLATIQVCTGANGICEYIKEVWEESEYTKPLEITRRFANDENIMATRRVKSGELKPFQRFIHFLVMKNVVPSEAPPSSTRQKDKGIAESTPRVILARSRFSEIPSEFERKRANRFHDDLEKAKAENARLLALLHQAQIKPHP